MPNLPSPAAGLSNDDIVRLYLDVESESVEKATQSLGKLGVGLEETKGKMAGLGQAGLQAGRVLQDFTQGGIGGILNNIEGLSMALGGGPGLAGILTAVGIAAFIAKPHLAEFWAAITGAGSNDVPKALEQLSRLNDELKTNKDRLEELKKQQKLTNDELSEYNARLNNTALLEEEVDKERKKRQDRDKLKAVKGDEEQAKERAENVMAGLGDQAGGVEAELIANAPALLDDIQKKLRHATGPERDKLLRQYEAVWNLAKGPTPKTAAQDLIAGAGIRGNEGDIQTILDILPGGSKFRGAFEGGAQANIDAGDRALAEAEEMGDRAHRGSAKFRRDFQRRINQDKLAEQLTEQGRDAENRTNAEREHERDHDATKARHDAEKAARERDPSTRLAARIKAREDAATVEAERQNALRQQAGAAPFSDAQLRSIASEAASFPGDLSRNIDAAMGQAMQKIMEMRMHAQQANARLNAWGQQFQALPQMGESRLP